MASLQVVTGYIPIRNHPRPASEYGALGQEMFEPISKKYVVRPFYETVEQTWLSKMLANTRFSTTHSAGDNPAKNTLEYHCVQHQKFGWLLKAALLEKVPDVFVWIDYGIAHVPGVTPEVVLAFLDQVRDNDLAIPGCWPRDGLMISDLWPCWRFCGGLLVVPRKWTHMLFKTVKRSVLAHMHETHNISWEVNTLARIERELPIRWYEADHNETMFKNYAKDLPSA